MVWGRGNRENLYNVPNFLTFLRVVLTLVLIYMFVMNFPPVSILWVFVVAALTDFFDGQIARFFKLETRFGAKFDILADRFLWISTGFLLLIYFPIRGIFDHYHLTQMALILTREIFTLPFVLILLFRKKRVMASAKWSGKTTTFLQGFAIPILIFSAVGYSFFDFSIYLAVLTSLSGIWALYDYVRDTKVFGRK